MKVHKEIRGCIHGSYAAYLYCAPAKIRSQAMHEIQEKKNAYGKHGQEKENT
jgi:hypothetical protein